MRYKEIENYPWITEADGEKEVVKAKVVSFRGEETLLIDITCEVPEIRIALTKKAYGNYIPEGSPVSGRTKNGWNKRGWESFNLVQVLRNSGKEEITPEDLAIIEAFTGQKMGRYMRWHDLVERHIRDIRAKEWQIREDKRQEHIKDEMKKMPPIPKSLEKWGMENVIRHYFFVPPFRGEKEVIGSCSACGEPTPIRKGSMPIGADWTCPKCGAKGNIRRYNFEARKKQSYYNLSCRLFHEKSEYVALLQRYADGLVLRYFYCWHGFVDSTGQPKEECGMTEVGRDLLRTDGSTERFFHIRNDMLGYTFWDNKNLPGLSSITLYYNRLYTRNMTKRMLRGTPWQYSALEVVKNEQGFNPISYLKNYMAEPRLELLAKGGLRLLAIQIHPLMMGDSKKPWEALQMEKDDFFRLKAMNGSYFALSWIKEARKRGIIVKDAELLWLQKVNLRSSELDFALKRMSIEQIRNYVTKQLVSYESAFGVVNAWKDYLSMANKLHVNLASDLLFRPKDLKKAHDEAVTRVQKEADRIEAERIVSHFPAVNEVLPMLGKYEFVGNAYAVLVPKEVKDIVAEGYALHHCVGTSDRYFDRIARKESFIGFVRRADALDTPYYTLEFEPGGTIRQLRTTGDAQDENFKEIKKFLTEVWQKAIRRSMDRSEKELAEAAKQARIREFAELRKTNARIWHGKLAGQFLADVLEKDLIIAAG